MDVTRPTQLRESFLNAADDLHEVIDTRTAAFKTYQIAGAGKPTFQAAKYQLSGFDVILRRLPDEFANGDGTVVLASAAAMAVPTYYVGMADVEHEEIMTSSTVLA